MWIPSYALTLRATTTAITTASQDKSNAVTVATWVTLILFVLVFLSREAIKFTVVRKFTIDDYFTVVATILAIGLSVTTLVLASDGLGSEEPLTIRRADIIMKGYYASNFLYISSIGAAKLALVTFFYTIHKVQQTHRRVVFGLGILILVWTLSSLVAVAFQCGIPRPWETFTLNCYNTGAFWIAYCIIDMTTDIAIIMLSVNLVIYLQIKFSRKVAVVACFAPRILVIGAALTRLIYLYPITPHEKPAYNLWVPVICTQVQVCLTIVTACIPYMRPFFYSTESEVLKGLKGEGSRRNMITGDESYTRFSIEEFTRGHNKWHGGSQDTTANSGRYGRTTDISPRIPSPPPLSPLTPPRIMTPPNSSASVSTSQTSSERGLKLQIPPIQIRPPTATFSPQTASSTVLSPQCVSPQPLLSGAAQFSNIPLFPQEPSQPSQAKTPPSNNPDDSDSETPPKQTPTQRFSLFPSPRSAPRYSRIPQLYPNPPLSIPTTISERSGLSSRSHTPAQDGAMSVPRTTPETHTPSSSVAPSPNPPNTQNPSPVPAPISHKRMPSEKFAQIVNDDPLRTRAPSPPAIALTTSAPIPVPLVAPALTTHSSNSMPSYYIRSPPMAYDSVSKPTQSTISSGYNYSTPPPSQPTSFPPSTPPISHSSPYQGTYSPRFSPTSTTSSESPQRQRNRRILAPQNASRNFSHSFHESPISPETPLTPLQYWREEAFGNGPGRTHVPGTLWEEQTMNVGFGGDLRGAGPGATAMPIGMAREVPGRVVLRDVRSSPRIVAQRFE